jgi:precorrin-2/cobalt-factor-2 C20-methyltransferase
MLPGILAAMQHTGTFYGVGVGPGERGMLPVCAWERVQRCAKIYVPRATSQSQSIARACLPANSLPEEIFEEVSFDMNLDHAALDQRYTLLAEGITRYLRAGNDVCYLTIGDTLTYSTFNYALAAVRKSCPEAPWKVFPGITSYSALAAATGFSLGEQKERVLILPCPDDANELKRALRCHHVVVVMKIGKRLPMVLKALEETDLLAHSHLGSHVGMDDQRLFSNLQLMHPSSSYGYLSTLLVRNPSPVNE